MTARKRVNEKIYVAYRKKKAVGVCDFCNFKMGDEQVLAEFEHFWLVKNIFGYDLWDTLDVHEHLLIVPKKHEESIGKFEPNEAQEFMAILADYESRGYSFYGRPMKSVSKSVSHQHTHLLKLGSKRKKFCLYLHKPYIVWFK